MKRRTTGTQFNCFSPPVMIATMVIETGLALYTLARYRLNALGRLVVAMLVALATFQLAEYHVCTGSGSGVAWSRLGFVAITLLPPLGLHIIHILAGKTGRRLVAAAYASMVAFIAFFLLAGTAFSGHQCTGNYVIFQFTDNVTGTYSVYYFGWLLAGIGQGWRWAGEMKAELKTKGKTATRQLQAVHGLIFGYLIFLVPSAVAMTVKPEVRQGIPSVLCGFAVLLALTLALYIMPRAGQRKG